MKIKILSILIGYFNLKESLKFDSDGELSGLFQHNKHFSKGRKENTIQIYFIKYSYIQMHTI